MLQSLAITLPYLIGGLLVLAGMLFLVSLQQLRRGRTGPYWRLRRTAGQRGGQLFLVSVTLFLLAAGLALFSGLAEIAYREIQQALASNDPNVLRGVALPTETPFIARTATATATPTFTFTPVPTSTWTPSPQPTTVEPSPSPTATLTPTPLPTLTPTATFEFVLALTPPPSDRQPRAEASIEIRGAAIVPDPSAVQREVHFEAGVRRVYFFFDYQQMDIGVTWTRLLYRDGVPIQGGSNLWSLGESGTSSFFFGDQKGYVPGQYTLVLYIGAQETSRFTFAVG